MADAISIQFPEADRRALFAQISRAQKELGRSLGQALRFAGYGLALTLGKATKAAPKKREVIALPLRQSTTRWGAARDKKPFAILFDRGSRSFARTVYARSKGEVGKLKIAQIKNHGLARSSWMWGVKALGGPGANFKDASASAKVKAQQRIGVRKDLKGDNPFVELRNRLRYIRAALNGGPSEINSALGKAARHMAYIIDADIVKKMGAK